MAVVRWTFLDPDAPESIVVPVNPNRMDSPTRPRNMNWAWDSAGKMRGFDLPGPATSWSFSGVLFAEAHYNLLLAWTKRLTRLHITDHLGRTFEVVIQKFDPVERLPTMQKPWRATYTMTCLLLKEVT